MPIGNRIRFQCHRTRNG